MTVAGGMKALSPPASSLAPNETSDPVTRRIAGRRRSGCRFRRSAGRKPGASGERTGEEGPVFFQIAAHRFGQSPTRHTLKIDFDRLRSGSPLEESGRGTRPGLKLHRTERDPERTGCGGLAPDVAAAGHPPRVSVKAALGSQCQTGVNHVKRRHSAMASGTGPRIRAPARLSPAPSERGRRRRSRPDQGDCLSSPP